VRFLVVVVNTSPFLTYFLYRLENFLTLIMMWVKKIVWLKLIFYFKLFFYL